MLRITLTGASALAMVASAAHAAPLTDDARAFGTRENVQSMAISPGGSKIAMLTAGPGSETVLTLADLDSGQTLNLTKSDGDPQSLRWCNFASESQLVCEHSGIEPYDADLVWFSGLITISADGKAMKPLRPKSFFQSSWIRQSDGGVIDWLPGTDGSVLMARRYLQDEGTTGSILGKSKEGLGVDRIALGSLKASAVEPPRSGASNYMTDGRGNVRLMFARPDDVKGQLTGKLKMSFRTAGSRDWRDFGSYDGVTKEGWYPVAIDADTDSAYALKKTNGRDALYRVRMDGSGASTLIGSDPVVDIDGVVRLGPGQRVIGYTYAAEHRRTVYFDAEFAKLQAALSKAIPGQPAISFEGATADGRKLLVFASGDTHAGTFYRFDKATKQLAEIAQVRPELAGRTLSPVKPITVTAADGVKVPAYLTIPAGSTGKNLPAVVLPHGGPSARDEWGFDWLPQFLAARGYAVIQPNFRGSAGYGDEWLMQNGFKSWRTAIGDVTAAAKYLVSEGIADSNKLAIVGWSYGGYGALQSAAVEPNLYRAAVAIAPVTDLAMLRQEAKGFTNEKLVKDFIGSGPHLVEGSPIRNVNSIAVPVLLIHGDRDANVRIAQSERMHAALTSSGKKVDYLRLAKLDHQLENSTARVQMLTRIGAFLDQAFGR